jgi:hypothetical protein
MSGRASSSRRLAGASCSCTSPSVRGSARPEREQQPGPDTTADDDGAEHSSRLVQAGWFVARLDQNEPGVNRRYVDNCSAP